MDLASLLFGKDPRVQGHLVTTGTTRVSLYELNQALVLNTLFGTSGVRLDITSSSASDASAGTGATHVTVYGLDANWKPLTEVVALNGQTAVTTVNSFRRVFAVAVTGAGTDLKADGDIYVVKTGTGGTYTAGVPGTLTSAVVKIVQGEGVGWSGYWTVPAGRIVKIMELGVNNTTQSGRLQVRATPNLDTDPNYWTPVDMQVSAYGAQGPGNINHSLFQFDAGTDLEMTFTADTSGSKTTAWMHINCIQMN